MTDTIIAAEATEAPAPATAPRPTATIDVVIVNFNTRERTAECIASVLDQHIDGLTVIVVDNGSTDGSAEAFVERFPEIVVIDAGENTGFARAVNRGVHAGTGDFVLLLNPDATVFPGSLEALAAFARAHPEYGVYGGRTVRADGSVDRSSCWGAPTLWSLFTFATMASTVFRTSPVWDPESLGRWERDTVREVPIITGCLLLTRRITWDALGGMDERFFLYGEDAEFSARARRAGYRPVIVPDAVIQHDVGGSTASSGRKMAMVLAGKVTLLETTWRPWAAWAGVALLQAGTAVRAGLESVTRSSRQTWRDAWTLRESWRRGYPDAEAALFGRTPPARPRTRLRPQRRLVVEAEPAFRTAHANPYTAQLAGALADRGALVRDLSYARVAFGRVDVIHLHWPDLSFLSGRRRVIHIARLTLFYSALAAARRRGAILVWTVHNVEAHEERSSARLRDRAHRLLLKSLDGILALSPSGIDAAVSAYPELAAVPAAVTRHGDYRDAYAFGVSRDEARARLGLSGEGPVLLFVGQIRAYKNVVHLVETFRRVPGHGTLLIAGHAPADLAEDIRAAAAGDPRIAFHLGFVSDDDLPAYLAAADLVVLPYRRVQNSGSAILALSAGRPVLVPDLGAMQDLRTDVGEDWVDLFEGELTAERLREAIDRATGRGETASPDLADFAWPAIATQTEQAYRAFRCHRDTASSARRGDRRP
ncbi:glycosyltransferase [Microbacterium sp. NPDC077184]|uniref:glycosyltransferase n=1 Tax=Microbacterium sp. NPDC077184 TaxID=3154764 RepID=UPI003413E230